MTPMKAVGRSDFHPPARKRASRQRVYEIQSHKDAAREESLMQDSPPRQTLERSLAVLVRNEP